MVEANPLKFYIAKYIFLFFAIVQWTVGGVLMYYDEFTLANVVIVSFFILFGILLLVIFSVVNGKIKRAVVGQRKIVILEESTYLRVEWPQVKSLRILPFINLCRLRIKGKKGSIYFFLAGNIRAALDAVLKQSANNRDSLEIDRLDLKQH